MHNLNVLPLMIWVFVPAFTLKFAKCFAEMGERERERERGNYECQETCKIQYTIIDKF